MSRTKNMNNIENRTNLRKAEVAAEEETWLKQKQVIAKQCNAEVPDSEAGSQRCKRKKK